MHTTRRRIGLTVALLSFALGASACGGSNSGGAGPDGTTTVTFADQPGSGLTTLLEVAADKGYFKDEGIEAKLVTVQGGPAGMTALLSGSVDVATAAPDSFAPAISKGAKLELFAGATTNLVALATRPGVTVPKDFPQALHALKGKTIGVTALQSSTQYLVEALLAKAGMSAKDVTFVAVGGGGAAAQAMLAKRVDAAAVFGPSIPIVTNAGGQLIVDLRSEENCLPDFDLCGVQQVGMWAKSAWIKKNSKAVDGIRRAVSRADLWLHDPANRSDVVDLLRKQMPEGTADDVVDSYVDGQLDVLTAAFSRDAMTAWLDFDLEYHVIDTKIDAASVLAPGTPETPDAVKKLGS